MSTKYTFNNDDNPEYHEKHNPLEGKEQHDNVQNAQKDSPLIHKGAITLGIVSFISILIAIVVFSVANKPQPIASEAPTYDERVAYLKQIADDELYDVDMQDWEVIQESSSVHEGENIEFTSMNNYMKVWNTHEPISSVDFKNFVNQVAGIDIEKAAKTDENYYIECNNVDTTGCRAGYSLYDDDHKEYRMEIYQPSQSDAEVYYDGNKNVIIMSVIDRIFDNLPEEEKNTILEDINNPQEENNEEKSL